MKKVGLNLKIKFTKLFEKFSTNESLIQKLYGVFSPLQKPSPICNC